MSIRLMSAVFNLNLPNLKTNDGRNVPDSTAKFVLLALADHASDDGEGIYPSIQTICKKTSLSSQTVCNAIKALQDNGFLEYVGKSKRKTKRYRILVGRIIEFQWLESYDSSGWNPEILVARINTSVEPLIKTKIHAPDGASLPQVPGSTGWPADVHDLALVFCKLKGRDPFADEKAHWIKSLRKYLERAISVKELEDMFRIAEHDDVNIKSPDSILYAFDQVRGRTSQAPIPVGRTDDGAILMQYSNGVIAPVYGD